MEREEKGPRPLKRDDVTPHLVSDFCQFLGRQLGAEGGTEARPEYVGLLQNVRECLASVYSLSGDTDLKVPRKIEDIFFSDIREDIKLQSPRLSQKEPRGMREDLVQCERGSDILGQAQGSLRTSNTSK